MKISIRFIFVFAVLFCTSAAWAVPVNDAASDASAAPDTTAAAEPDRMAEDFVKASLLIFAPGEAMYSQLGHACFRMKCPYYNLDYCFTYESEDITHRVLTFLTGTLNSGVAAIPTDIFLKTYDEERRAYTEYELRLPPQAKTELWRVLDEHVARGMNENYDYIENGCAIVCVHLLQEALKATNEKIVFQMTEPLKEIDKHTMRELFHSNMPNSWSRSFIYVILGEQPSRIDNLNIPFSEKLIIPADLVVALQNARIASADNTTTPTTIIAQDAIMPDYGKYDAMISPLLVCLLILALSLANIYFDKPFIDWIILAIQTALGILLVYLVCISSLPATRWNLLLLPFNPLPAIFWRWRKRWALPYGILILVWSAAMSLYPHLLVSAEHIILAIAFAIVLLKTHIRKQQFCADAKQTAYL